MESVPDWIAIVGSGYIGLEFSDVYTALGSEVVHFFPSFSDCYKTNTMFGCPWEERRERTEKGMSKFDDQLLAFFTGSLFDWSRAWGITSSESLPLFLSSLFLCN